MRGSVRLRAYGQRDPLIEYKREGLKMFKDMEIMIWQGAVNLISQVKAGLQVKTETQPQAMREVHESVSLITGEAKKATAINQIAITPSGPTVGRNEPCPCGSGKKYKHCGLVNAPEHKN